jgi:hypothetical protein
LPFDAIETVLPEARSFPSGARNGHPRAIGAARKREEILILWTRDKAVPLAIAGKVGLSVTTVSRVLAEEGIALAPYLTTTGRREKHCCPHCGKDL